MKSDEEKAAALEKRLEGPRALNKGGWPLSKQCPLLSFATLPNKNLTFAPLPNKCQNFLFSKFAATNLIKFWRDFHLFFSDLQNLR